MRLSGWSGLVAPLLLAPGLLLASGCANVGTACDQAAAEEVVYNASTGAPAFAGQSLVITSCASGGSFCHSDIAERRFGAPAGMNFDPTLADASRFDALRGDGPMHLLSSRRAMLHFRDEMYEQVLTGAMPPGALGRSVVRQPYRRFTDDPMDMGVALPSISSPEGHEILRNWLACGAPVVERTTPPPPHYCTVDSDCPLTRCSAVPGQDGRHECELVGYVIPRREVNTAPHWDSIYRTVIADGCAISQCHDAAGSPSAGGLDMHTAETAYMSLVMGAPGFPTCAGDPTHPTRIVPGHPETSFFLHKLDGSPLDPDCGVSMPISGDAISMQQIEAITTWIQNGALDDTTP